MICEPISALRVVTSASCPTTTRWADDAPCLVAEQLEVRVADPRPALGAVDVPPNQPGAVGRAELLEERDLRVLPGDDKGDRERGAVRLSHDRARPEHEIHARPRRDGEERARRPRRLGQVPERGVGGRDRACHR